MSREVAQTREELTQRLANISRANENPNTLSLSLERDEAKKSTVNGAWVWDTIIKYFPTADRLNWKNKYYPILKKAVMICQSRGVQIGIVHVYGRLSPKEKQWVKDGFYWKVQRFPKIGRLTKTDAKRLQDHKYNIINGFTKSAIRVLKSVGYSDDESKKIFLNGTLVKLQSENLLPNNVDKKLIEKK